MMKTDVVGYFDGDVQLEGFSAYSGGKLPLVLLCHAWRGRDEFICEKAKLVADLGYAGFAIDMYGKGVIGQSKEENAALKKPFIDDRAFLQRRLLAGVKAAYAQPYVDNEKIAVLGFGFGGVCALELARSEVPLKGAVSIYGHFDFPQFQTKAEILLLHGYKDPVTPIADVIKFQEELSKNKVKWQAHIYGDAYHAFATPTANDLQSGIVYNEGAAKHAWNEVEHFLRELF